MAVTRWLIDKSALARLGISSDADLWADRVSRGLVHICTATRLEVGYSARSGVDAHRLLSGPPVGSLVVEHFTPAIEERAIDVLTMLAESGRHRGPSLADLLIAATAELRRLTVLHLDKDFEMIASVTGQSVERLRVQE